MASHEELFSIRNDSALQNRVESAVLIAAEAVMLEDPATENNTNRRIWAKQVFAGPRSKSDPIFNAILAAYHALSEAQIRAATDEQIDTAVTNHIDLFADGS